MYSSLDPSPDSVGPQPGTLLELPAPAGTAGPTSMANSLRYNPGMLWKRHALPASLLVGSALLWGGVLVEAMRPNPFHLLHDDVEQCLLMLAGLTVVVYRFQGEREHPWLVSAFSAGVIVGSLIFLGPLVVNLVGWM